MQAMSTDNKQALKSFVTSYEAAHMLGVTMRTIQQWTNLGLLSCWKTKGGHRRIMRDSVERLLVAHGSKNAFPGLVEATAEKESVEPLRILIVEDEPALLRIYRLQLARWPMAPEVSTATNGVEGLVMLGSTRPHLLIADLHLPEMDGFQMLRTLRAMPQLDATEMVVVTGIGAEEIARRGGLPEGIQILPKPIPFAELKEIAERIALQSGCRLGGAR
jgi:excisionase family DNA binding protein